MKRTLLSILTLLVLNFSYGQVQLGLKAGLNFANIQNKGTNHLKTIVGFNAGTLLKVRLTDKLLLRPELLYSVKGYRSPANTPGGEATLRLDHINLPILFGYSPIDDLSILVGPEFGYLTSAKTKYNGSITNVSKNYRDFDTGIDLGLAYNLSKNIGVDLRYNYGFKGLVNLYDTDPNGNRTRVGRAGANRVVQIGLYYLISK